MERQQNNGTQTKASKPNQESQERQKHLFQKGGGGAGDIPRRRILRWLPFAQTCPVVLAVPVPLRAFVHAVVEKARGTERKGGRIERRM